MFFFIGERIGLDEEFWDKYFRGFLLYLFGELFYVEKSICVRIFIYEVVFVGKKDINILFIFKNILYIIFYFE